MESADCNGGSVGQSTDGLIALDVLNILSDNAVSLDLYKLYLLYRLFVSMLMIHFWLLLQGSGGSCSVKRSNTNIKAVDADKSSSDGGDVGQSVDGLVPIDLLNILSDNAVSYFP